MAAIAIDGPLRGRDIPDPPKGRSDAEVVANGPDHMPYRHTYEVRGQVATHKATEPVEWSCGRCGRVAFRRPCCGECSVCCDCGQNPYEDGRC